MADAGERSRVVIVGGGFGGLQAARALRSAPVQVTVVDRTNHHLFQPLLYQVATAGLSPADIAQPIRSILRRQRNTEVVMGEVAAVDTAKRLVHADTTTLPYDYLVLAPGSHYNYFGHDEWAATAPALKTVEDARDIRRRTLLAFEAAELEDDPEKREALLTFVLVGGGPTGVEMAGALAELATRALAQDFRRISPGSARILLLEAAPRILGPFDERLAHAAQKELERLGVDVRCGAKVDAVDEDGVTVGGERIPARTVIWTAGVVAEPAAKWLGVPPGKGGRVAVQPDCSVPGLPNVFVIGDAAEFQADGQSLPGLAPVAMQAGTYVGRLIAARVQRKPEPGPFRYHDKGILATVGRAFAIVQAGRLRLSGLTAWLAWLAVHIWYLIGFRNRVLVLMQWAWAYIAFQRGARLITGSLPESMLEAPESRESEQEHRAA